jgi:hypothetical protein
MASHPPDGSGEAPAQLDRPPGLDEDAHSAVVEELDRIDAAEHWSPPGESVAGGAGTQVAPTLYQEGAPQRGYRQPDPPTPHGEGPHVRSVVISPEARVTRGPRDPKTLEDLYAIFPHIGNGIFFMRVTRKEPKLFRGEKVNGWITDVHDQITLSQFRDNFGGERFTVAVLGPRPPKDAAERPTVQQLAEMDIQIPGPPAFGSLPRKDEDDIMTTRQPLMTTRSLDPAVATKELELQAERERRSDDERQRLQGRLLDQAGTTPGEIARATSEAADRAAAAVERRSEQTLAVMRETMSDQQRRIGELTDELKLSREELVKAKAEAAQALYHGETKAVTELRERQNRDLSDLKDRTTKELSDLKDRAAKELLDATSRLQNEMSALKERHADELRRTRDEMTAKVEAAGKDTTTRLETAQREYRERAEELTRRFESERGQLREDHRAREQATKDDYERQERNYKESYENRIRDLERQTNREIAAVNSERDVRVQAIESQYKGQVSFTEKTTAMQLDTMTRENARLEAKLEQLEGELQRLREKTTEDVPTAIAKAHTLAEMTGWSPGGKDGKDEEGDFDWKKAAAKIGMAFVEKSPEIMQKLGEIRAGNAQAAQTAAAAPPGGAPVQPGQPRPGQQQRRQQLAPPPGFMRPAPPQGRPFVVAPPSPAMAHPSYGRGSVVFGAQPTAGTEPPAVAAQPMPPMPIPQPAPPNGAPVASEMWSPPPTAAVAPPAQPVAAAPAQPAPAPAPAPPAGGAIPGLTEQHIGQFIGELENAIRGKVVSPNGFANLFIGQVGGQLAAQVVMAVDPDQLIQAMQQTPEMEGSQIVQRHGQKYVREVWDELRKALGLTPAAA